MQIVLSGVGPLSEHNMQLLTNGLARQILHHQSVWDSVTYKVRNKFWSMIDENIGRCPINRITRSLKT